MENIFFTCNFSPPCHLGPSLSRVRHVRRNIVGRHTQSDLQQHALYSIYDNNLQFHTLSSQYLCYVIRVEETIAYVIDILKIMTAQQQGQQIICKYELLIVIVEDPYREKVIILNRGGFILVWQGKCKFSRRCILQPPTQLQ